MAGSALFGMISLFLTAGACVMIFLIVLAGTTNHSPLNQIYFLWADTSAIKGAPKIAEWTLWNVCSSVSTYGGGNTMNCGQVHAGHAFQPQLNFNTQKGVPGDFLSHPKTFYYLSRFSFAFYLISLFFMITSLAAGLLSLCSRLGSAISMLAAAWALFCMTATAAIMTAVFILGRNAFHNAGHASNLGLKALSFTWASVACMLVATALYCLGFTISRKQRHQHRGLDEKRGMQTRSFRSSRTTDV